MEMTYSETLKKLFEFTDVKLIVLAKALDYDISYISKWCNGSKVPSVKSINAINKKASSIFARAICEDNKEYNFYIEFNLIPPSFTNKTSLEDIELQINTMLKNSYKKICSLDDFDEDSGEIKFLLGSRNIYPFINATLNKLLLKSYNEDLDIYTSIDIFSYNAKFILEILEKYNSKFRKTTIHLGYPLKIHIPSYENMLKIYSILCEYPHVNIEIFNNSSFKYSNFLIVKDHFFFDFSIDKNGFIQTMTFGDNINTTDEYFDFLIDNFKDENLILELTYSKSVSSTNFRTSFYSGDNFYFFCNYGFEFLLPPDLILEIAKYSYIKTHSKSEMLEITKLKITWEEIFENSNINFFILKSTLFDYLENGNILYCNTRYTIPAEQRQNHYNQVIKLMKENPNIKFYIIDDFTSDFLSSQKIFSLYYNDSKLFFKNNSEPPKDHDPSISILRNNEFSKFVLNAFTKIKESPNCVEYDSNKLAKAYNKYGQMFKHIQIAKESIDK